MGSKAALAGDKQPLSVWFDHPAASWEAEGLPIGNGAMGAVVSGDPQRDLLQFNEKSLWTGGPGAKQGYDFGLPDQDRSASLTKARQLIAEQGSISPEAAAELLGHKIKGYGDYQTFGDLVLTMNNHQGKVTDYRRELSLDNALVTVTYRLAGVSYKREYFASFPAGLIVVKLSADKPGSISFSAALAAPDNRTQKHHINANRLALSGELKDNRLQYEAQLQINAQGGKVSSLEGRQLLVESADSAVLLLGAATNYAQNYPRYRGRNPHVELSARLNQAQRQSWAQLLAAHISDYHELFNRVKLDIGQQPSTKTTSELLLAYQQKPASLGLNKNSIKKQNAEQRTLEATYFQFGRYLLIASSRAGSLPANLQGVWNNSTTPPWNSDYHVNINLQMNYWLAETTNLAETTAPLFNFVDSLVEPGKVSAKKITGAKGWTLFLNTNIWGFTGVIDWPTAFWQPEAGAWMAQHYYEHYLFSGDEAFLAKHAYPLMKGAAQFWLDFLVRDPRDNQWVATPSFSPEQGGFTAGAAMSQQIVFDLLRNTLEAAELLGDKKFAAIVQKKLVGMDKGLRIGKWGQLQEWKEDVDDATNQHRHISQLFALHPGRDIDEQKTPALYKAAAVSLNARGDGGTGWSKAWKVNLWARLGDGNRAHKLLAEQLQHSTLNNLWDTHPPFQIDGNFGATAGMAEMLVQSHSDALRFLPALPDEWPSGAVSGLRARGGLTVNLSWQNHELASFSVRAKRDRTIKVKSGLFCSSMQIVDERNAVVPYVRLTETIKFDVKKGREYHAYCAAKENIE